MRKPLDVVVKAYPVPIGVPQASPSERGPADRRWSGPKPPHAATQADLGRPAIEVRGACHADMAAPAVALVCPAVRECFHGSWSLAGSSNSVSMDCCIRDLRA